MKHENDRAPGKYDVLVASKELAGYTLRITSNEKNFPKRYRFSVVGKIQDKALQIVDFLIMANEIYPNWSGGFFTRRRRGRPAAP